MSTKLNPHIQINPDRTFDLSTLSTNYAEFQINLNGYPSTSWFGNGTASIPEGVRGSIQIPIDSAANNHGAGIAGYAITSSTTKGAVGAFGCGLTNADGASVWGANVLAVNSNKPQPATMTGKDSTVLYGLEIDINMVKKPDGSTPTLFTRGLYLIGASECKGTAYAIDVDGVGINQSPIIGWDAALHTADAACGGPAIDLGTVAAGNNVASQSIQFRSRDSGGVDRNAFINADASCNLNIAPGSGGSTSILDGSLNTAMTVAPNGSTPYVSITNALQVPSTPPANAGATGIAGQVTWDANFLYVCVVANTWKRVAIATW